MSEENKNSPIIKTCNETWTWEECKKATEFLKAQIAEGKLIFVSHEDIEICNLNEGEDNVR